MSKYENKLSTLAARSLIAYVKTLDSTTWDSSATIEEHANNAVDEMTDKYPSLFPVCARNAAYSLALSVCFQKALTDSKMTVKAFIISYAMYKWEAYLNGDKGAFGDLFEILVRIALLARFALVRPSMLHVAEYGNPDIKSKKYGRLEVGHNGKTLSFGTVFDYMAGPYDSIAYAALSDDDKNDIVQLCVNGNIDKAIEYIREYTAVWTNKYNFLHTMDGLTRGKGITVKGDDVQVVFNPGKYTAFTAAIENGIIIPMKDGDN